MTGAGHVPVAGPVDAGRPFGLPKRARLLSRADFDRASRGAPSRVTAHFKVVRGRGAGGGARLGLIVPRKVGAAVARNRVKRLVREWFRLARPALPPELDVVVIARPGAARLSLERLARELDGALARPGGRPRPS